MFMSRCPAVILANPSFSSSHRLHLQLPCKPPVSQSGHVSALLHTSPVLRQSESARDESRMVRFLVTYIQKDWMDRMERLYEVLENGKAADDELSTGADNLKAVWIRSVP